MEHQKLSHCENHQQKSKCKKLESNNTKGTPPV
ncbi:hypothetical protein F441_07966 [Phytophthora nicotianae CJ01A1]|uniref:Uncharacterized protein n=5 Tax=Phytophthora nicotianae TaxID=4792 RepID=W2QAY6_PHYN3|nr:hypothetical protein PPTG_22808 [Phytophthora nicotianae INRA-310]ETI47853.1 hypothetical protein F443_07996 [Phytophthora nicotianae P1569]ETO76558.1 hypothetical protein F444_08041 [Phytophthora nicotianae P1976]ETP17682.1 hypothetical protein F441_07966 [Phytophthora nicotianae CJ01A1]ETP45672.1 hypothetical protein F442_07934 [Phytophthora nicotianae P10297]ETN10307.1 hypothetical protein PPTG_22808 [Phytophthora nicotianae INRA-310]